MNKLIGCFLAILLICSCQKNDNLPIATSSVLINSASPSAGLVILPTQTKVNSEMYATAVKDLHESKFSIATKSGLCDEITNEVFDMQSYGFIGKSGATGPRKLPALVMRHRFTCVISTLAKKEQNEQWVIISLDEEFKIFRCLRTGSIAIVLGVAQSCEFKADSGEFPFPPPEETEELWRKAYVAQLKTLPSNPFAGASQMESPIESSIIKNTTEIIDPLARKEEICKPEMISPTGTPLAPPQINILCPKTPQPNNTVSPSVASLDPKLSQALDFAIHHQWQLLDQLTNSPVNRDAVSLDRPAARAANTEGKSALQRRDIDGAVNAFLRGTKADAQDPEIVNNLAFAFQENSNHLNAIEALNKALALAPRRSSAWVNLFTSFAAIGNLRDAEAAMTIALRYSGNRQRTLDYLSEQDQNSVSIAVKQVSKSVLAAVASIPSFVTLPIISNPRLRLPSSVEHSAHAQQSGAVAAIETNENFKKDQIIEPSLARPKLPSGKLKGLLVCGESLEAPYRPGWTDKVHIEIQNSTMTWLRHGIDNGSEYHEAGIFQIASNGKSYIDAVGQFLPGQVRKGNWRTQGTATFENDKMIGNLTQINPSRTEITRYCNISATGTL